MKRERRFDVVAITLLLALGLGLAGFLVLISLATRGQTPVSFVVGRYSASTCSVAPAPDVRCYQAVVTNSGDRASVVRCELRLVDGGSPATFANGQTVYQSPVQWEAGSSKLLEIRVTPVKSGSPALPELSCVPV